MGTARGSNLAALAGGIRTGTDKGQINVTPLEEVIDFRIGFPLDEFQVFPYPAAQILEELAVQIPVFLGGNHGCHRHPEGGMPGSFISWPSYRQGLSEIHHCPVPITAAAKGQCNQEKSHGKVDKPPTPAMKEAQGMIRHIFFQIPL